MDNAVLDLTIFGWLVFAFIAASTLFLILRIEVGRLSNLDAIAAVVVQLGKAKDEILAKVAGLEAAAAAGEDLSASLADLAAAAQALDDVVPDAVVEVAEPVVVEEAAVVPVEDVPVEG